MSRTSAARVVTVLLVLFSASCGGRSALPVGFVADVSSAEFYAATGNHRPDPTGLIACPQPCNVHYTAAYSLFQRPTTRYAASWEPSEDNFDYLLTYEFENQILNALGYDMRWR